MRRLFLHRQRRWLRTWSLPVKIRKPPALGNLSALLAWVRDAEYTIGSSKS